MNKIILIAFVFFSLTALSQNVGIGTVNPSAILHVEGNSSVGYPNIRLQENEYDFSRLSYYNSGTTKFWDIAARSEENDANSALNFYNSSTGNLFSIKGNGKIGIGNAFPEYPLNFANALGDKISFWNSGSNCYGIGMQDYLLQIHTSGSGDDIAFGYGSSANLTELMRIKGNGNIGIGNANPTYKLDISGRLRVRNSTGTAGIYFDGTTQLTRSFIGTYNEDYFGLWGAGSNWGMVMNVNNGNIGLGNTDPSYKMDISGRLRLRNSAQTAGMYFDGTTLPNRSFFGTLNEDHVGIWGAGAGWNMVMNVNNGNVGIGKSDPSAKLHVKSNSILGTPNLKLEESEDDFARIGLTNAGSTKFWEIAAKSNEIDANSFYNIYNNSTGNLFTIRGNGNVGIGNSSPEYPLNFSNTLGDKISFWNSGTNSYGIGMQDYQLQIHTSAPTDDIAFGYGSSTNMTDLMRIKGNGNVGIGNNDPSYKLDITGRLRLRNGAQTAGIYFDGTALQNRSFVGTLNEDHVGFWGAGSGWNMVMNVNTGNVGIGDSNPSAKLEVNGFTKLGSNAPAIKMKQVDDVLNVTAGQAKEIILGIATLKILSVNVMVGIETSSGNPGWVPNSYTAVSQHEFNFHVVNGVVVVTPKTGNSNNILNKTVRVMVTYLE